MFGLLTSVYPRLGAQHRAWKLEIGNFKARLPGIYYGLGTSSFSFSRSRISIRYGKTSIKKSVCIGFRKSKFDLFILSLNKAITIFNFWLVICYLVRVKLIFLAIVLKPVLTSVCFMYQVSTCESMFWATLWTPYVMLKDEESGRFFCDLPRRW